MFWDKAAGLYDLFEKAYNGKVNEEFVLEVSGLISHKDIVLECACGTGMISEAITQRAKFLIATDYSEGMIKQAKKKCGRFSNILIEKASILDLHYEDNAFDKVVAGNVIHLLENPMAALKQMQRVCKDGGKIIIPTYVNSETKQTSMAIRALEKFGAKFQRQFDFEGYKEFFAKAGIEDVEYTLVDGRMPCAIAVIRNHKEEMKNSIA